MALFGMISLLAGLLYLMCALTNSSLLGPLMPFNSRRDQLLWGGVGLVAFILGAVLVFNAI